MWWPFKKKLPNPNQDLQINIMQDGNGVYLLRSEGRTIRDGVREHYEDFSKEIDLKMYTYPNLAQAEAAARKYRELWEYRDRANRIHFVKVAGE